MLDENTAKLATDVLSTAIAARLEEGVNICAIAGDEAGLYAFRASKLTRIVEDVAVLTAALIVVSERV